MRVVLWLVIVVACSGTQRRGDDDDCVARCQRERFAESPDLRPSCHDECTQRASALAHATTTPPLGRPSDLKTPIGAASGPRIDAPARCSEHGMSIRVHGTGVRGFEDAFLGPRCRDPDGCVRGDDLGAKIVARLAARGITDAELGGCGLVLRAVVVHDWRHVDAAIAEVDAELRAHDVGESYVVAVDGISPGASRRAWPPPTPRGP